MVILIRNVLVVVAIIMWVVIGLVFFAVTLRNKMSGKMRIQNSSVHKDTFVRSVNNNENNSDSGKSGLCL